MVVPCARLERMCATVRATLLALLVSVCKAALAAAKARGVKLGWSIPERASEQRRAARKGAAVNKARALAHAENVLPVIEQIRAGGASLRQIAAELNARSIKTARGGKWHATTVRNILTVESGAEVCAA